MLKRKGECCWHKWPPKLWPHREGGTVHTGRGEVGVRRWLHKYWALSREEEHLRSPKVLELKNRKTGQRCVSRADELGRRSRGGLPKNSNHCRRAYEVWLSSSAQNGWRPVNRTNRAFLAWAAVQKDEKEH